MVLQGQAEALGVLGSAALQEAARVNSSSMPTPDTSLAVQHQAFGANWYVGVEQRCQARTPKGCFNKRDRDVQVFQITERKKLLLTN